MQRTSTHALRLSKRLSSRNLPSSLQIQPVQIGLPANRNAPRKDVPELRRHVHEAERSNNRPELNAVFDTNRESLLHPLPRLLERRTSKKRVHAKEVRVEDRSETRLLHDDFRQDREEFARVVEMVAEEHEPEREVISVNSVQYEYRPLH